jgi:hypothetical protein
MKKFRVPADCGTEELKKIMSDFDDSLNEAVQEIAVLRCHLLHDYEGDVCTTCQGFCYAL